jgi:hypothetical protein
MPTRDRPVLVTIISTLGVIIAALITSGYFTRATAAKREDALEANVRKLETELKQCQSSSSGSQPTGQFQPKISAQPPSAPPQPVDVSEAANRLQASHVGAQRMVVGIAATGVLAENAVKEYVFVGTENTPLLFRVVQPKKHFSLKFSILSSSGGIAVSDRNFYGSEHQLSFTPLKSDAYILKLTGARSYGDYIIEMSPLADH